MCCIEEEEAVDEEPRCTRGTAELKKSTDDEINGLKTTNLSVATPRNLFARRREMKLMNPLDI